jgi:hypothetical protein
VVRRHDVGVAKKNWRHWKRVFEYEGAVVDNPLLADEGLFNKFLHEYSVGRTIREGMRDRLRITLRDPSFKLQSLLSDRIGKLLDKQEAALRKRFGAHDPPRAILSALSKIAAFLAPDAFIAWDKYARAGLGKH